MQGKITGKKIDNQIVCIFKGRSIDFVSCSQKLKENKQKYQLLALPKTTTKIVKKKKVEKEKKLSISSRKQKDKSKKKSKEKQEKKINIADLLKLRKYNQKQSNDKNQKIFYKDPQKSIGQIQNVNQQKILEAFQSQECPNFQIIQTKQQNQQQQPQMISFQKLPTPYKQQKQNQPPLTINKKKEHSKQNSKERKDSKKLKNSLDKIDKNKQIKKSKKQKKKKKIVNKQEEQLNKPPLPIKNINQNNINSQIVRLQNQQEQIHLDQQQKNFFDSSKKIIDTSLQFAQLQKCIEQQIERQWNQQEVSQIMKNNSQDKENNYNYVDQFNSKYTCKKQNLFQLYPKISSQEQKEERKKNLKQVQQIINKNIDSKIVNQKVLKNQQHELKEQKNLQTLKNNKGDKKQSKTLQKINQRKNQRSKTHKKKNQKPSKTKEQFKSRNSNGPLQNEALKKVQKLRYLTQSSEQQQAELANMINSDIFKLQVSQLLKKQKLLI